MAQKHYSDNKENINSFSKQLEVASGSVSNDINLKMTEEINKFNSSTENNPQDDSYMTENNDIELITRRDKLLQEIHNINRKINEHEIMKEETYQEISIIEESVKAKQLEANQSVQKKKEEYRLWRLENDEIVKTLEKEIEDIKESICNLKFQLNEAKKIKSEDREPINKEELERQKANLIDSIQDLQIKSDQYKIDIEIINNDITQLEKQREEFSECIKIKDNQLSRITKTLEDYKEKLTQYKTEYEEKSSIQQQTDEGHKIKGNSMFAEIEDNICKLQEKKKILIQKCNKTKNLIKVNNEKVENLQKEVVTLTTYYDEHSSTLFDKIKNNNSIIDILKKKISEKYKNIKNKISKEVALLRSQRETYTDQFSYLKIVKSKRQEEILTVLLQSLETKIDTLCQNEMIFKITEQKFYWKEKTRHLKAKLREIKHSQSMGHEKSILIKSINEALDLNSKKTIISHNNKVLYDISFENGEFVEKEINMKKLESLNK